MALTQMQLIQSLGEAMSWFERELSWEVKPTSLVHLCGRIGELYAALITNGQMATKVNQEGYDVVSGNGEKISVKTTAKMDAGGHVSFSASTLDLVDRVIILRMNTDEMQIEVLLDATVGEVRKLLTPGQARKLNLPLSKLVKKPRRATDLKSIDEVDFDGVTIRELENGTIEVEKSGEKLNVVKPTLRQIAAKLNVGLINGNGNKLNTRSLGTRVIEAIKSLPAKNDS